MDWSDLGLRAIRMLGALASALAGIAALLTQGAFARRKQALTGFWAGFPFARYRATPWGVVLLAVILIAPTVQFIGDWVKDDADAKALKLALNSATRHLQEKVIADVHNTVATETHRSTIEISNNIRDSSRRAISLATISIAKQQENLSKTQDAITSAQRDILSPFSTPRIRALFSGNCTQKTISRYCKYLPFPNYHIDLRDFSQILPSKEHDEVEIDLCIFKIPPRFHKIVYLNELNKCDLHYTFRKPLTRNDDEFDMRYREGSISLFMQHTPSGNEILRTGRITTMRELLGGAVIVYSDNFHRMGESSDDLRGLNMVGLSISNPNGLHVDLNRCEQVDIDPSLSEEVDHLIGYWCAVPSSYDLSSSFAEE